MTGHDALALCHNRHQLACWKAGLASFIGYAFSNNTGLSLIAGACVRSRLYSAWGLSALQIEQVVVFGGLTLWLGSLASGDLSLPIEPLTIPATIRLPLASQRVIGIMVNP